MKEAVLLVGHGSRAQKANRAMENIAQIVQQKGQFPIVEIGYMELCPPTIQEGIAACVKKGASRIVVLPYFLHMGMHVQRDLPRLIEGAREDYPDVTIIFGKHIGFHTLIADILLERYQESIDPKYSPPTGKEKIAVIPQVLLHDEHGHGHHHHGHHHHHHDQ